MPVLKNVENKSEKKKPQSMSSRSGVILPVSRIHRILREGHYAPRISVSAAVYLTGALEYVIAEILELASQATDNANKVRITPRFIFLAVKSDYELDKMLQDAVFVQGGVLPHIQKQLLNKKKGDKNSSANDESLSQEY